MITDTEMPICTMLASDRTWSGYVSVGAHLEDFVG